MRLINVGTLQNLYKYVHVRGAIRTGSTIDPKSRSISYQSEGYRGIMYYAPTQNMKKQEDNFLKIKQWLHNIHTESNSPETQGYIYIIQGRRNSY